jgi:hypothetical protein
MLSISDALKAATTREGAILAVLQELAAAEDKILFSPTAKPTVDRTWLRKAIHDISRAFGGPVSSIQPLT